MCGNANAQECGRVVKKQYQVLENEADIVSNSKRLKLGDIGCTLQGRNDGSIDLIFSSLTTSDASFEANETFYFHFTDGTKLTFETSNTNTKFFETANGNIDFVVFGHFFLKGEQLKNLRAKTIQKVEFGPLSSELPPVHSDLFFQAIDCTLAVMNEEK
jgi:hypothetical protein